jgi:N utilization substance protein B
VGRRRKGREILLQAEYASQLSGRPLDACLDDQLVRRDPSDETATFARNLATKLVAHRAASDRWLAGLVENWDPERVGQVERAILRIALTELRYSPDVPWRVVINEACELARRFCEEDAVGFVNGVLDRAAVQVLAEEQRGAREEGPA